MRNTSKIAIFLVILFVIFLVHAGFRSSWFENVVSPEIIFWYVINAVFTTAVLVFFSLFFSKLKNLAGYLFLATSVIKVIVFILLSKMYEIELERDGLFAFLIPFSICLFCEVLIIGKMLNRADFRNDA